MSEPTLDRTKDPRLCIVVGCTANGYTNSEVCWAHMRPGLYGSTAAATLAENDRQAAELARYVEHKDEVMRVLRNARIGLFLAGALNQSNDVETLVRLIEGKP